MVEVTGFWRKVFVMRKSYNSEALPELGGSLAVDMYTRISLSPIRHEARALQCPMFHFAI